MSDSFIAQGFTGEMRHYFHPQRFGGYRYLGDDRAANALRQEVLQRPCYKCACEWANGQEGPMEDTDYYKMLLNEIEQHTLNGELLGTPDKITNQYNGFKALFNSIRVNGYKPRGYVFSVHNHCSTATYYYGDITLLRLPDRSLIFGDGRHRMSILLALNQPIFYVEVNK